MSEITLIPSNTGHTCQNCQGTGWETAEDGSVLRCPCVLEHRRVRLMAQSGLPKRYEHCDFDSYQSRHGQSLGKAKMKAMTFVTNYSSYTKGLLFLGPCGVGKTHLAVSVIKALIFEKRIPCLFYDFRELIREIQNSYNPSSQTSEMKILTPILESEILLLDELGAANPTTWVTDTISYVINRRYNENRITIFTSNYLDKPSTKGEDTLTERVGHRMRSRLYEMCHEVIISGEDFRKRTADKKDAL